MAAEAAATTTTTRPHVVLTSFPAQGHLKPMLNLAKLLHSHNFHVTFVVTDFTYRRLVRSRGPESVRGLDDFRFRTIPDGLPPSDLDATQDIPALCESARRNFLGPFMELMKALNNETDSPRVTCIVSDGAMSFAAHAGHQSGIPVMLFYTHSGCGLLSYISFSELVKRGYSPLKGT